RRRKQHATVLLRALGLSSEEILLKFYKLDQVSVKSEKSIWKRFFPEQLEGQKAYSEIKAKDGRVLMKEG
ncbi:hypothetical protein ACP3WF_24680, partial [Salmonella enterica]|uniref:hypothetical protein n=1 Tax=Salmonella enterica TaxID=28901 RepID=UPI003CFA7FAF